MKKLLSTLLIGTMVLGLLAGCQKTEQVTPQEPENSITAPQDDKETPSSEAGEAVDNSTVQSESPSSSPSSTPNTETPAAPQASTEPSTKPNPPSNTPKPSGNSATPSPAPDKPTSPAPENSTSPNTEKPSEPSSSKLSGALGDIAKEIYALIPEDEQVRTFDTAFTNDNADNKSYYLGTADITITEGLASEPMINAIAHSLVLVRVPENTDIKEAMEAIKKNVNPRKWICVGVEDENVRVLNHNNLIILIMNNNSQAYVDAFITLIGQ